MIKVYLSKDKVKISGHSDYAQKGYDIVCSSASSIFITTVNAILKFDDESISYKNYVDKKNDDNDYSLLEIKKHSEIVDTLILNMIELFDELEIQYPKEINIIKEM